ncbi:MAG: ribbon-helix-helix protein, CopG family [Candidatus Wallbacteria bacterium]|nr:ribbon-helix-helix protein, CopG family [Candidatus Wallbacteria bacterium]
MRASKIAITMDAGLLEKVDRLVAGNVFPSRSRAIQVAVEEALERIEGTRLARECAKLDPEQERALAEEGFGEGFDEWPPY